MLLDRSLEETLSEWIHTPDFDDKLLYLEEHPELVCLPIEHLLMNLANHPKGDAFPPYRMYMQVHLELIQMARENGVSWLLSDED